MRHTPDFWPSPFVRKDLSDWHLIFQNTASWDRLIRFFGERGYHCIAESWPCHHGALAQLTRNPRQSPHPFGDRN